MDSFINRIIRAAKLDTSVYEEVEADKKALRQAMGVVILSSMAFGIGLKTGLGEMILGMFMSLVAWYVWAYIIYFIGTRFLPEPETKADHGELLRTLGFASSPGLIRILGLIIPAFSNVIFVVVQLWMLIAMVIAVRQALDYKSTLRATFVCVLGWVFSMLVIILFSLIRNRFAGA